jgi:HlyD family secretion protein
MNRKRLLPVAVVLIAAAAIAVWLWRRHLTPPPSNLTASGTVEATESRLGFQYPGRIASIAVREGEAVRVGEVLARLDRDELDARHRQAMAQLEAAESILREMENGSQREEIAQAAAALQAANERLADTKRDLDRSRTLYHGGAISEEAYQKAATAEHVAETQVSQAGDQLALVRKGPRKEKIDAQKAQVEQARANLRASEAALANADIVAPINGVVTVRHHEPNEIVAAGEPVLTLMNPADRWVRIYVPEDRIGAVHLGTPASISTDTDRNRRYSGQVIYISPEAEFTPKSVQTSEERVRLVYAVKVSIESDSKLQLKPGMPADVVLNVGE